MLATEVARQLGMRRVIVPPSPGLFSAFGLLLSNIEHELVQTFFRRSTEVGAGELEAICDALETRAHAALEADGFEPEERTITRQADLRYSGQAYELTVPIGRSGTGAIVAQGLMTPMHMGTFPHSMRTLLERWGDDMHPGDVFITNDPYGGGGLHLPDIYVTKPIFLDGRIEGCAATLVHHTDVGGITPGSTAVHATEIYQEGLRIPLVKLYERGRLNETVIRFIEKNVRVPRNASTIASLRRSYVAASSANGMPPSPRDSPSTAAAPACANDVGQLTECE